MLAPMSLAQPSRAWQFALLTTLASVAGGLFGYAIGYLAFDAIVPWLRTTQYWASYLVAVDWLERWGFWAVFVAGLISGAGRAWKRRCIAPSIAWARRRLHWRHGRQDMQWAVTMQ